MKHVFSFISDNFIRQWELFSKRVNGGVVRQPPKVKPCSSELDAGVRLALWLREVSWPQAVGTLEKPILFSFLPTFSFHSLLCEISKIVCYVS